MNETKSISEMYIEFCEKYNEYPVQMSRYEAFQHALDDGLISKHIFEQAEVYYGRLWNYVGD